ncbi:MAG: diguanylate cyclase, partial [Oscillospiraceae bacterium]
TCVMVIIDIDNFKKANDLHGHEYGDKIICAVADKLRAHFKKKDIIVRMGGDEFAVFISDIYDVDIVEKKAQQLCDDISEIVINNKNINITCSVGVAISDKETRTFELLYQNADKALYNAKCRGRNKVSVYGEESAETSVSKWINDAQSVLNVINDCVYACDLNSYEIIYANDNFCEYAGITLEECNGKKCYEVLMHRSAPCNFCNLSKMSDKKVYTRVFHVPNTKNIFLMRGKNVNRNGNMVHLEVAVDITDVENMNTYWD